MDILAIKSFEVDGINYTHPFHTSSVYIRPIIQLIELDAKLVPMRIYDNKPKKGLMDSEIDEEFLEEYWEL